MKREVAHWFPRSNVTWEHRIDERIQRRADAVVEVADGSRFVVECQASRISVAELVRRTADLNWAGLPVAWVFSSDRFRGRLEWDALTSGIRPVKLVAEILLLADADEAQLLVATPRLDLAAVRTRVPDPTPDPMMGQPRVPKTTRRAFPPRTVQPDASPQVALVDVSYVDEEGEQTWERLELITFDTD